MFDKLNLFESIDYLISTGKAGSRHCLAQKFNVSERTISRLIEKMKGHGAEIYFCRTCKSYKYRTAGNLVVTVKFQKREKNEL